MSEGFELIVWRHHIMRRVHHDTIEEAKKDYMARVSRDHCWPRHIVKGGTDEVVLSHDELFQEYLERDD